MKFIVDEKNFEEIKNKISGDGAENFQVIADFDRTVTYGLSGEGKRTATVISQLRSDPKYLGEEYQKKAHELFDIYRPIEIDTNIGLEEKKEKMHEWWQRHFDLIADVGLTKDLIKQVVKERPLKFREGLLDFVNFLEERNIPLVFMSAAPGDMLIEYLEANNLNRDNVYVVANLYDFDEKGNALKIKEPIIHTFNKIETSLEGTLAYDEIKDRKNVLLLGDSVGDVGMVGGFDYDALIKIGFLNENVDEQLNEYKKNFDVVLTGDQDFSFVNQFIREVLK